MKEVLFVQGAGRGAHDEWDNNLVDSLRRELGARYEIRYPRLPNEADSTLADWQPALENEFVALRNDAIVAGHSVGGTILINVITRLAPAAAIAAIVLIAASFIGDGGWPSEDIAPLTYLAERLPANVPVFLYHEEDDETVPTARVDLYAKFIPHAQVRRLAGRDHQLNGDLSEVARDILGIE